jgi:AhpC/TSA family
MKRIQNLVLGAACLAFTLPALAQTGNIEGLNVGNIAPEIEMKNPNDSMLKLSSLRGKLVLIDFWASWSMTTTTTKIRFSSMAMALPYSAFHLIVRVEKMPG